MIIAPIPGPLTIGFRGLIPGQYSFTYYVGRPTDDQGSFISSLARVFITILAVEDPDPDDGDGDDDGGDDSDDEDSDDQGTGFKDSGDETAALPDTGSPANLQLIGGTGIAFTILGMFTLAATPRRRPSAHRA